MDINVYEADTEEEAKRFEGKKVIRDFTLQERKQLALGYIIKKEKKFYWAEER